jgi:xylulokinase
MLAAVGVGWFKNLHDCATALVDFGQQYSPISQNVEQYHRLYEIYHTVYRQTQELSYELLAFRQGE